MAFGFVKKLVEKLTGKKSAPAGQKSGGTGGDRSQRGTRGRRGRHGKGGNGGNGRRDERRGDRRDDRRRDGSRRGPAPVNTAANEMRPGGVVSAEEVAARKAAHAAWSPDSFKVEPVEGKKRFHDFDLPGEVMHGIADLGFQYCTEIQALSLQNALDGKNIAGKAQTGSGKTAAFLVAILTRYLRTPDQRADKGGVPRALVIAPTRELVIQICKDADAIGKYCNLRSLAVYGGMDYDRQRREILDAPVDLLVATPGRLLDFCNQRVIDLSKVDTLVIDEADRMLDMGFIPDVRRIMGRLPPKDKRATMLYSATLTDDVMNLASQWMEEPVKAEVESEHNATDTVRQVVYVIRSDDKFKVLFNHVALHPDARAIVFCNRKSTTEDVYESLKRRGVSCEMLSGDVNQNKRLKVLDAFREGEIKIVVATDVAGRGIHVDDVEYVINFDFPYEAEDYVHRIGRTGRAGNTG
ncbi:MAG: DEAD/DEAH box helicase, partial [Kiritimatiellae bacterium]|nr:DEAD/DEAH box helicase [Kiritimatiellia bacterium]